MINNRKLFRFILVQMHQDDDIEWRRASGDMRCSMCGLTYREHPMYDDHFYKEPIDHRLCNGEIVHL